MKYNIKSVIISILLIWLTAPSQLHADDMKESKNFWMNVHSNYLEFTVLVTDLHAKNTWAKDGYIRAYNNEGRNGTPITLLRVYTKDMGNDYEPLWEVYARNMIRGSKAFMQNTVPQGDADPQGALSLEETTFYVNKGSSADDTYVIIDYYYPPELAGKTWYFFYEYEHNSSGKKVMSLGSAQCSETVDCSHFDLSAYTITRTGMKTIQVKLPVMPDDIDQKLKDVRKHFGHYDLDIAYTLFDGSVITQTASFDCQSQVSTTGEVAIPVQARNFKTIDITVEGRDALEADGGQCFWDDRSTWDMKNVFAHVPQPNNLGIDYLQFDKKVDLTWNAYTIIEGLDYLEGTYPYIYRMETDQYGTPKSGQSWSKRAVHSAIGEEQNKNYTDQNVNADGKYYKYLILNVPKAWENKDGLTSQALQNPSEETIQSLGHVLSEVISTAPSVNIYNLQQDVTVKDKVRLTWEYSRVPVSSGTTAQFEVWRSKTGTTNWDTYATNITGDANPKAGYVLSFTDTDLPNNKVTYDYKVVLKLNGGKEQFESNVVTAGLLSGTTVTALSATKGTHDKVVRLEWKANQVGTGNSNFELLRRYAGTNDEFLTIYHTTGTSDSYTYEDNSVQPGRYYEYMVKVYAGEKEDNTDNNFQNMLSDIGFCQARGVITGRVTFGTNDTSVEDVRLTLHSSDDVADNQTSGHSQRVNGASTGIVWETDDAETAKIFDSSNTVQFFVRPDEGLSDATIASVPGEGHLVLSDPQDGNYRLTHVQSFTSKVKETYTHNLIHLRAVYYFIELEYPYPGRATFTFTDDQGRKVTVYNDADYQHLRDQWEDEGYHLVREWSAYWVDVNDKESCLVALYSKTDDLVLKDTIQSACRLYDTGLTVATGKYSLVSLFNQGGKLTFDVDGKSSSDTQFLKTLTMGDGIETIYEIPTEYMAYKGNYLDFSSTLVPSLSENEWIYSAAVSQYTGGEKQRERDMAGSSANQMLNGKFSIGGFEGVAGEHAFRGNLTEVRVWDHQLTEKERTSNDDRILGGRENGLLLYWPMDEGINRLVFDASYSNDLPNGRHAVVGTNINVSNIVPTDRQLSRYAVTNSSGEYTLRGIPFVGSGTTYTLTPSKSIHVFSPTSRNGFISASNLTLNNYNFTDESSFIVRGKVTYLNTNIPVDSITFKVDGTLAERKNGAATTDANGEYEISVPIGHHRIEAYREGHLLNSFPADGTTYDFHQSEVVNFTDSTLVNVTGRVNGGFSDKSAPLGFHKSQNRLGKAVVTLSLGREAMSSFNYIIDSHGDGTFGTVPLPVESATDSICSVTVRGGGTHDDTKYIYITTDSLTGEFSALLPPLRYKVERITFAGGNDYDEEPVFKQNLPTIDATNTTQTNMGCDSLVSETGEVKYYKYAAKFMRQLRTTPTITVSQSDMSHGGFGATEISVNMDNGEKVNVPVMYEDEDENAPTYFYGHPLFVQRERYTFDINVSERYKNLDTKEIISEIPEDAVVSIMNNASLSTLVIGEEAIVDGRTMTAGQIYDVPNIQVVPDKKGDVRYIWTAGWPNLSEGYLRNLSIGVKVDGRTTMWKAPNSQTDALDLVVLGGIPTGSNFITRAPDHVDMVIRRPPGSTASTTLMNDTIHNYYYMESSYEGDAAVIGAYVNLLPTFKVASGPIGFLIGTSMRPYLENTTKATFYDEEVEMEDSTHTYTVSTTMRTPSGSTYTQNNGDTYIGRGTNILFCKGRTVGLFRQPDGTYKLDEKESMCFSNEFTTTFVYPQQYIEDVQIPNWRLKIESLLKEVTGDLSDDNVCPVVEGKVVYYTNLKKGDPRRGTRNIDDCWTTTEREAAHGYPSYRMVSGLPSSQIDLTDSIQWCNSQIEYWQDRIAENEQEKLEVFELDSCLLDNYSIAYGTSVTQTTRNSQLVNFESETHKKSYTVTLEIHQLGYLWNNAGGYAIVGYNNKWGNANTTTSSQTEGSQFSWTISDAEPTTALSVNVYKSKCGWGPIFRTMGGQTSNPYEGATYTKYHKKGSELDKATMRCENPKLSVDGSTIVTDVPTGGKAEFILEMKNDNEVNVPATYVLDVLDYSNPDGAVLTIDGAVLSIGSGGRVIKFKAGETIKKTLYVSQSSRDVIDYKDIGLILRSQKDSSTVSTPVFLNVHFVPASALVEMSVDNTVLNEEAYGINKGFLVTLTNLDRQDAGLAGVRIQYRRKGTDAWVLAKEWKVNPGSGESAIPEGKSFSWPVIMEDDGIYEMRAQTFGQYGPDEVTYATPIIEVTQDLSGPRLLGMPYPENGMLSYLTRNDMHIRFNKDINSNALSQSDNFRIEGYLNNAIVNDKLPDTAVQLNGDDITTQSTFDMGYDHFSIEGWFYRQGDGTLFSVGTEDNMLSLSTHDDGKLKLRIGSEDDVIETDTSLPSDIWNYVVLSYHKNHENDGTASLDGLYINADRDFPMFFSFYNDVPVMKGSGRLHVGGNGMVGMVHDLAVWNDEKTALDLYQGRNELKASYTPGLIGYWRMDEGHGTTVRDRIRSRNFVLPTESWYINNRNLAAHLSGTEPLSVNISKFAPLKTDNYALELWFRGDDVESNEEATLLSVNNRLRLGYQNGAMILTTYDEPGNDEVNSKEKETFTLTENNYNDNQWHHLALNVRRGTGAIAYIDGQSVKTIPEESIPAISGNYLFVGDQFTGDIDEVRIWNAALTGETISERRYERLNSTYAGLIGYFPMESIHRTDQGHVVTEFSTDNFGDNSRKLDLALTNAEILSQSVNSPALLPGAQRLRLEDTEFDFSVSNREIYFTFPEDMLPRMDGNEFTVTVSNVKDVHNNSSRPIIWNFHTDFSIWEWATNSFEVTKNHKETKQFTLMLFKYNAGSEEYEILNLPSWITTENRIGTLSDNVANIDFTILPSAPMGKHHVFIYVSDKLGIKRAIRVEITVTGEDPEWTVDDNLYESNMIVIGQLYVGDKICEYEKSSIAAFDEMGNCRGVAHPEYINTRDAYYLNMNIFGASSTELSTGQRALTFKMYDASTGIIHPLVQLTMPDGTETDTLLYTREALYGNYDNPVLFKALDGIEQPANLTRGWNWISIYVQSPSPAISDVMPKGSSNVNNITYVKGHRAFATTKNGQFIGELTEMYPGVMYKIQTKKDMLFNFIGKPIDVTDTTQTIYHGYNWIGTLSSEVMSPDDAFADLKPKKNDMVKNRSGFSLYLGDGIWEGVLKSINPGEGYIYYSGDTVVKQFHYPKLGKETGSYAPILHSPAHIVMAAPVHYTPVDAYAFPDNMNMIAVVVKEGERLKDAEIGAFINGECRGAICANAGSDYYFLTIMGSSAEDQNQTVELRVFAEGTEYVVDTKNTFINDNILGSLDEPYVLDLDEASGIRVICGDDYDDDGWYTLQGYQLPKRPSIRGVYIHKGTKVVIE